MHTLKRKSQRRACVGFFHSYFQGFFSVRVCFLTGAAILAFLGLSACAPGGFRLLNQLEARQLKNEMLNRRAICFQEFVNPERFADCYEEELFDLLASECVEIRQTEPIPQNDCEDFLYRIVMKPDSFFPGDSVFPAPTGDEDRYRLVSGHALDRAGGCGASGSCITICWGLFESDDARDYCSEYSVTIVTKMKGIFSILETAASVSNLNSLNTAENQRYLKIMLNIEPTESGNNSVLHRIDTDSSTDSDDPWSEAHQKTILKWLSESPEMIRVFSSSASADSSSQNFELLEFVSDTTGTMAAMAESITRSLDAAATGDDFIDELINEENEEGLKWLHAYFEKECDDNDTNEEKRCVFEHYYCNMDTLTGDNGDKYEYVEYGFFRSFANNILKEQRKADEDAPGWWKAETQIEDFGSRRSWKDICDWLK